MRGDKKSPRILCIENQGDDTLKCNMLRYLASNRYCPPQSTTVHDKLFIYP